MGMKLTASSFRDQPRCGRFGPPEGLRPSGVLGYFRLKCGSFKISGGVVRFRADFVPSTQQFPFSTLLFNVSLQGRFSSPATGRLPLQFQNLV